MTTSNSVISLPNEPSTLNLSACLHPLNIDEMRTCESIIRNTPGSSITPMPTHHIDQHGRLCGFTFSCPSISPISALPLSRNMFFGHTACECDATSSDIVKLLSDIDGARKIMENFMKGIRERAKVIYVSRLVTKCLTR